MTTLGLTFLICFGGAVQIVLFAGIAFLRYWKRHQALRAGVEGSDGFALARTHLPSGVGLSRTPAWEVFRPFRVVQQVVGDGLGTICSFDRQPVVRGPLPGFLNAGSASSTPKPI